MYPLPCALAFDYVQLSPRFCPRLLIGEGKHEVPVRAWRQSVCAACVQRWGLLVPLSTVACTLVVSAMGPRVVWLSRLPVAPRAVGLGLFWGNRRCFPPRARGKSRMFLSAHGPGATWPNLPSAQGRAESLALGRTRAFQSNGRRGVW